MTKAAQFATAGVVAALTAALVVAALAQNRAPAESLQARPTPTADAGPTPLFAIPEGRALTVLFAGDSLTQGSYASSDEGMFRSLVAAELLSVAEVAPTVTGQSGQTAGEAATEVAAPAAADISVIEYGTNDVVRSTVERFAVDYPTYLDRVQAASPGGMMLCLGAWGAPDQVADFDQIIKSECEARDGVFLRTTDLFINESNRAMTGDVLPSGFVVPDNFHPNDAGHAAIADRITDALWR